MKNDNTKYRFTLQLIRCELFGHVLGLGDERFVIVNVYSDSPMLGRAAVNGEVIDDKDITRTYLSYQSLLVP